MGTVKRHLIEKRRSEINLWCLFVIGTCALLVVFPPLALISIPWAVYLVSLRQRSNRQRKQELADRADNGNAAWRTFLGLDR